MLKIISFDLFTPALNFQKNDKIDFYKK